MVSTATNSMIAVRSSMIISTASAAQARYPPAPDPQHLTDTFSGDVDTAIWHRRCRVLRRRFALRPRFYSARRRIRRCRLPDMASRNEKANVVRAGVLAAFAVTVCYCAHTCATQHSTCVVLWKPTCARKAGHQNWLDANNPP